MLQGLQATVTTSNGDKFQGIFAGVNREQNRSHVMLKMTRNVTVPQNQAANRLSDVASPFLGNAPDHAMSFDFQDVVDVNVPNVTSIPANPQKTKKGKLHQALNQLLIIVASLSVIAVQPPPNSKPIPISLDIRRSAKSLFNAGSRNLAILPTSRLRVPVAQVDGISLLLMSACSAQSQPGTKTYTPPELTVLLHPTIAKLLKHFVSRAKSSLAMFQTPTCARSVD